MKSKTEVPQMPLHPLMKCGCVAQGTCRALGGKQFDPPVPSCVVHDCIEIAETLNLDGRMAKCAYNCGHMRPSSLNLAFFEFLGEGAPNSIARCKCGMYWIAHQPSWIACVKVVRKWYDIPRIESVEKRNFRAPTESKERGAEKEADFFRSQMRPGDKCEVFSVEVLDIIPDKNNIKCKEFVPIGARPCDRFYCGCRGWD